MMGRGRYFEEFAALMKSPVVEDIHSQLVNSVHNLGVLVSSSVMLSSHIAAASVSNTFYYLQLAKKLHPILLDEDLSQLFMPLSPLSWITAMQYPWA